ncbi:MAG TPA: efflux RND transporter periplasmic adaptor subunit [Chitinophagaceae bacterium]|nr:efflux RND transporter periplasmic adaptor subunit [Chitinophagaceae bacterium]
MIAAQSAPPKRPTPRVDGFLVQTKTISESLEVPGSIVADESTEIHPEVSGRITRLYVREGAHVNKGALLAKLYDADLQAQRRKLQVQLQIARQTESRYNQLQKIGGISKQDYDVTALQVNNIRADLEIINTEIARTEIRAPFSGKLGLRNVSTGAYVTPQSIIASIHKTSNLRIDFTVPEKYIPLIKNGHYVNFTTEGNNRNYTAVVAATESGIEQTTRSLTIRAKVKGDHGGLVPGAFAKVKLAFEPNANALMIPTQAIIPQARGKKVVLYNGGTAKFVDVTTSVRDSSQVQVIEGLNAGDTIVITGLLSIKPDAPVQLNKIINQQ